VLVATVRALAWQGAGAGRTAGTALDIGCENLGWHVGIAHEFGLPVVVAVNRYPDDTEADLALVLRRAREFGAEAAVVTDHFARGASGAEALAEAVEGEWRTTPLRCIYDLGDWLPAKIESIARRIYNADGVDWSAAALGALDAIRRDGADALPVCIAKTPYSISHDRTLRNVPRGYRVPVRELRADLGAGYVRAMLGDVLGMPGLGPNPRFREIDVDLESGRIAGLG
jgi:formyltetrahydrofolate synthetase